MFYHRSIIIVLFFIGFIAGNPGYGQTGILLQRQDSISLFQLLTQKAREDNLRLFCDTLKLSGLFLPWDSTSSASPAIVDQYIKQYNLGVIHYPPNYLVIVNSPAGQYSSYREKFSNENITALLEPVYFDPSKQFTIDGIVEDGASSEPVIGATLYINELKTGVVTNGSGYFSITLPSRKYSFIVSAISFARENITIPLSKDTTLTLSLFTEKTQLDEVIIYDQAEDHNVTDISMGITRLNIMELKHIPPLMGELDILKSILLLPGVTSVGEGSSGFNVRGGSVDQNLILLDDAPIFNPSHLFGFFSAINSTAIKDVTLSKGGIPAQYGGRVSSIVDIKTRQGNNRSVRAEGGIGLLTSNATVDGPLLSDKTTFLVSGRVAYSDWYLNLIPDVYLQNSTAYFHDMIGKITHRFNSKNTLSLTAYTSMDKFSFPGDTTYGWSSNNLTLSWSKYLAQRLFMNQEIIYSNYTYTVTGGHPASTFIWNAGINYYNLKGDFTYNMNFQNKTDFGYSLIYNKLNMGTLGPDGDKSVLNSVLIEPEQGFEPSVYFNHEYILNQQITLMGGLRYNYFMLTGPGEINIYSAGKPRTAGNITGTRSYGENEPIVSYGGFEPRISIKYGLDRNSSLKASYNRMRQNIHLISNTSAISPVDVWKLSDPYLKPQVGDQVSAGYFRNLNSNVWETSLELYYKFVHNVIDYKDGADLVLNPDLETDLVGGVLRSYGMEVLMRKTKGRLTGSLSYTLSRTERKVSSLYTEETINSGRFYPAPYDKLHDLSLTGNYQFTRRHSFGFSFIINSGRPITYPVGSFIYFGFYVPNFEVRNQERTPGYNRVDISFTIDGNHRKRNRWHGSWTFAVYNLLGRDNPYSIFFKAKGYRVPQAYSMSVIGIPVPSLTYNFKFE